MISHGYLPPDKFASVDEPFDHLFAITLGIAFIYQEEQLTGPDSRVHFRMSRRPLPHGGPYDTEIVRKVQVYELGISTGTGGQPEDRNPVRQ